MQKKVLVGILFLLVLSLVAGCGELSPEKYIEAKSKETASFNSMNDKLMESFQIMYSGQNMGAGIMLPYMQVDQGRLADFYSLVEASIDNTQNLIKEHEKIKAPEEFAKSHQMTGEGLEKYLDLLQQEESYIKERDNQIITEDLKTINQLVIEQRFCLREAKESYKDELDCLYDK